MCRFQHVLLRRRNESDLLADDRRSGIRGVRWSTDGHTADDRTARSLHQRCVTFTSSFSLRRPNRSHVRFTRRSFNDDKFAGFYGYITSMGLILGRV